MNLLNGQFKSRSSLAKDRVVLTCGIISLAAFVAARALSPEEGRHDQRAKTEAARIMERAIAAVREHCISHGMQFNDALDPNHTGLIGLEYSEITTTVGSLEAKRTTTNPNMAGVVLQLLEEAGVLPGDTIAVGCSASFPALMIATLAASKAVGVHPVMILSLGASSFGATRDDFTLLDIYGVLKNSGIVDISPAGVSLGGAKDVGQEYEAEMKARLVEKIRLSGFRFLNQADLQRNVSERMAIYLGSAGNRRVAAFVNIGGNYANLGASPLVLKLNTGVNALVSIPAARESHGVVFAMAERHIAVIHLLHIKGLALKYGLPWDPFPLPKAGDGTLQARSTLSIGLGIVASVYFSVTVLIFVLHRKTFFRTLSQRKRS
jgi:poly-gamma-glutamate system protein